MMRARPPVDRLGFPTYSVPDAGPYVMRGPEIATSLVRGADPAVPALPRIDADMQTVRDALERAMLSGLQRPPCLVAFSGGLDSSTVLAVATTAARKHGLPLPIPVTNRFPEVPDADESSWQEMVVSHLGLEEWVRLEIRDELDLVGPVAAPHLLAHGVLFPANAHFLTPLSAPAAGGTLLTGIGGDELFTPSSPRGVWVLARKTGPRRTDVIEIARVLSPPVLKRRRLRRRFNPPTWLTRAGRRLWVESLASDISREPLWWGRSVVDDWWRSRARVGVTRSVQATAADSVVLEHPFMDPAFAGALAGARWQTGFRRRSEAIEFVAGDSVPVALRERPDKTAFFGPFFNRHSRAFAEAWDGTGVDPDLVDVEALRHCWQQAEVDARSYLSLQSAWLAGRRP
jgi:hypothetical protein